MSLPTKAPFIPPHLPKGLHDPKLPQAACCEWYRGYHCMVAPEGASAFQDKPQRDLSPYCTTDGKRGEKDKCKRYAEFMRSLPWPSGSLPGV